VPSTTKFDPILQMHM